ncbi:MAG: FxsA family protein [Planctomycetota bacterium]
MARLLALFLLVPIVELVLLIQLGKHVGLGATLGLIVATGFAGAWLTRRQGLGTLARIQAELGAGSVPTDALIDGLLILLAGAVLLTPGLLTDAAGFLLLVPATRRRVRDAARGRLGRAVREGRVHVSWNIGAPFAGAGPAASADAAREPEWEVRPGSPESGRAALPDERGSEERKP